MKFFFIDNHLATALMGKNPLIEMYRSQLLLPT